MDNRSERIRRRIDRYKQGLPSEETAKKRKFSRALVLINIILLVVMIFFFKRPVDRTYHTTSIEFDGALYRLSMVRDTRGGGYNASLSVESASGEHRTIVFGRPLAELSILHDDGVVDRFDLGESTTRLALHPGETRNFVKRISDAKLLEFSKANPETLVPPRRTIFSREQFIPLKARLTINTGRKISTTLNFNYEVER
ncbi:MAG TPA: hypothetical protein VLM75_06260 [Spirochaetota bacterium]|nr:hypothetical protein [Spirochaetota bacterium]